MKLFKVIIFSCFSLSLFYLQTNPIQAALNINPKAPNFSLKDVEGNTQNIKHYRGKLIVLEWFNYNCPFVKKYYENGDMQRLQKIYTEKGVIWLSICSTHKGHRDYLTPQATSEAANRQKVAATAVLLDTTGDVGKRYNAKTTPHFFIISPEGKLIYQGAIDSIRSVNSADIAKADNYIQLALDEALQGKTITLSKTKPYGCSVKYR